MNLTITTATKATKVRVTKALKASVCVLNEDGTETITIGDLPKKKINALKARRKILQKGQVVTIPTYQRKGGLSHMSDLEESFLSSIIQFMKDSNATLKGKVIHTHIRISLRSDGSLNILDGGHTLRMLICLGCYIEYLLHDLSHMTISEAETWEKGEFDRLQSGKAIDSQHSFEIISSISETFMNRYRYAIEELLPDAITRVKTRCQSAKIFNLLSVLASGRIHDKAKKVKDEFLEVQCEDDDEKETLHLTRLIDFLKALTGVYSWEFMAKRPNRKVADRHKDGSTKPQYFGRITPWNDGGYLMLALGKLYREVTTGNESRRDFVTFMQESKDAGYTGAIAKALYQIDLEGSGTRNHQTGNKIYAKLLIKWNKWIATR